MAINKNIFKNWSGKNLPIKISHYVKNCHCASRPVWRISWCDQTLRQGNPVALGIEKASNLLEPAVPFDLIFYRGWLHEECETSVLSQHLFEALLGINILVIFVKPSVWPDCAIYWTLCNFSKPLSTISLPKSPTFLGNFC